tara:strand:- start:690 stop:887 length:198 start_codon:yes stop_codon:yes gene_type:complete
MPELFKDMKEDVRAFQKHIIELVVYSEVISYNDAWNLTQTERELFFEIIKEKLDAKSGKKKTEML